MRVRVYATLRDLLGTSELAVDPDGCATAGDLLQRLSAAYPALGQKLWDKEGRLSGLVTVLLNGRMVNFLQGLETPVSPDDELNLFPPVGGG